MLLGLGTAGLATAASVSNQFNDQVIEINQHKQIVFSQGKIQVDGNGFHRLNAPYDAKVIGDCTGLTPPLGFKH